MEHLDEGSRWRGSLNECESAADDDLAGRQVVQVLAYGQLERPAVSGPGCQGEEKRQKEATATADRSSMLMVNAHVHEWISYESEQMIAKDLQVIGFQSLLETGLR